MNLMKHNLVERGLAEYKVGLLYLLDRIIRRGKGYTGREGVGKSTTFTTCKIGGNPERNFGWVP